MPWFKPQKATDDNEGVSPVTNQTEQ